MRRLKTQKMKKTAPINFAWVFWVLVILLIVWFIRAQNNLIITKNYVYTTSGLPKSFVGYKIAHVSDLCNNPKDVVNKVKRAKPDVILVSGGYFDESGRYSASEKTINELASIAPLYYIYNKADSIYDGYEVFSNTAGVNITDTTVQLNAKETDVNTFIKNNYGDKIIKEANKGNEEAIEYLEYIKSELSNSSGISIDIAGLGLYDYENGQYDARDKAYEIIGTDSARLSIILNSNINNLNELCKTKADIVLFGGTYGVNTISEEYTKGYYGNNGVQLFVSGGVSSIGVSRFMNFPEIQIITLSDGTLKQSNPLENFLDYFIGDVGHIFENDGGFEEYEYRYDNE